MINTLYSLDALDTSRAFFLALLIGFGFGFALERAGFSSSRRLAGVFYFTDMAVVKVMFSAVLTALLGLSYLIGFGWIQLDQIFLMPTLYGAQIVGGLLFGVGFVMGAWCPGTAAAGLAAGRIDALVFLLGTIGGSILFNELFPLLKPLYTAGNRGAQMAYDSLGISRNGFVLAFTGVAVAAFWFSEWAEKARTGRAPYLGSPFLKAFSLILVTAAAGLFVLTPARAGALEKSSNSPPLFDGNEKALMGKVEQARDHIEPEALADRLTGGEPDLVVVDVRPAGEFAAFHIRGSLNVPIAQLAETLLPFKNKGLIVLYSNGMTHPAQARDSLQRLGFGNAYLLTDGLQGFRDRCLKPVSLRPEPLTPVDAARVNAWRAYFLAAPVIFDKPGTAQAPSKPLGPQVVETDWVAARLAMPRLMIIDLRPQPEYNAAHLPGSLSLNVECLRGNIKGVPSMLLPPPMLAAQFSLLGLRPSDSVILVSGDKLYDTTLAGLAFERLGHTDYAVLNGGFAKWDQEGKPVNAALPVVTESEYPVKTDTSAFATDFQAVNASLAKPGAVIIDVRPADFYTGKKSDEARAGHIPGAINRPFSEDVVVRSNKVVTFKPTEELAAAYGRLIPSTNTEVIVHCRTGHQASQTFFVLKHLLGYPNVRWYDAGWTEWAARPELPIASESRPPGPERPR
jgi:thiosulfate/3-mercaptopyruvate sulfurtransferase